MVRKRLAAAGASGANRAASGWRFDHRARTFKPRAGQSRRVACPTMDFAVNPPCLVQAVEPCSAPPAPFPCSL